MSVSEAEFIKTWKELGTKGTAEKLGIAPRSVRKRKEKISERTGVELSGQIPDGHHLKGKSTLYDADGNVVIEWVKTNIDKEESALIQAEIVEALKEKIPRAPAVTVPKNVNDNLLTLYPVGDHHFGMLAWGEETGNTDYDLEIAEALLSQATDHLVKGSPQSEEAALLILGDFLHYDSFAPVTPLHKNLLDADSRFPKMVRVAIRAIRHQVNCILKRHQNVRLIIEIGNHDMASAIWLMECFAMFYESEPRVTVDNSPRPFHCFTFGQNMIGTHHGHSVKLAALPLLFATDWPEQWGGTKHRSIHTGHVHHDQVKESPGVTVESHGILPPQDAYAAHHGYRSKQSMKAIVLHKEFGEVARYTVNPEMLKAAQN